VKDRVNVPLRREFESDRHRGDNLHDFERTLSSGCEFGGAMR
jgi:hypothetical protein